jgi:hypothetical protein
MGILGRTIVLTDRDPARREGRGGGQTERNVGGREAGKPDRPDRDGRTDAGDDSTERNVGG